MKVGKVINVFERRRRRSSRTSSVYGRDKIDKLSSDDGRVGNSSVGVVF